MATRDPMSTTVPLAESMQVRPVWRWPRAAGWLAMAGAVVFLLTMLTLQLVRHDLDWQAATLSQYLSGPYGLLLRTLCVLAVAIVLLASGVYASLAPEARSAAPPGLLAAGALALSGVAIGDSWLPAINPEFHLWFHHACAIAAFLFVSTGMVLQAWRFRFDMYWRRHFAWAMPWALVCHALLWVHALWPPAGQGWVQKLLIVMIVSAMLAGGHALSRAPLRAVHDARR